MTSHRRLYWRSHELTWPNTILMKASIHVRKCQRLPGTRRGSWSTPVVGGSPAHSLQSDSTAASPHHSRVSLLELAGLALRAPERSGEDGGLNYSPPRDLPPEQTVHDQLHVWGEGEEERNIVSTKHTLILVFTAFTYHNNLDQNVFMWEDLHIMRTM